MTRGNFVTPTNVSVTQDLLGNNLKKNNIGLWLGGTFQELSLHYNYCIISSPHSNFSLLHNKKLVFKGIHYSV